MRAPVLGGQQGQRFVIALVRQACLVLHQLRKGGRVLALQQAAFGYAELPQFVCRQVDAATHGVFAHVANDVGELQGAAQPVGVFGGLRLGLPKDAGRYFAHHARNQVAVLVQLLPIGVAVQVQIHMAALDDGEQVPRLDAKPLGMRHQRQHDGVAGFAGKGLLHFVRPPAQLGSGNVGFGYFIHHIIHFTAKRVKSRNGGAFRLGQKQKGVIKAAARRDGFFLYVCLRRNALRRRGHGLHSKTKGIKARLCPSR